MLYRMDWTDKHPGVVFAAMGLILVLKCVLEEML